MQGKGILIALILASKVLSIYSSYRLIYFNRIISMLQNLFSMEGPKAPIVLYFH